MIQQYQLYFMYFKCLLLLIILLSAVTKALMLCFPLKLSVFQQNLIDEKYLLAFQLVFNVLKPLSPLLLNS